MSAPSSSRMLRNEYRRQSRADAAARGMCSTCCGAPAVEGGTKCQSCVDYGKARYQRTRECADCKAPGTKLCIPCARKRAIARVMERRRNRDAGKCGCGQERADGDSMCSRCRATEDRARGVIDPPTFGSDLVIGIDLPSEVPLAALGTSTIDPVEPA